MHIELQHHDEKCARFVSGRCIRNIPFLVDATHFCVGNGMSILNDLRPGICISSRLFPFVLKTLIFWVNGLKSHNLSSTTDSLGTPFCGYMPSHLVDSSCESISASCKVEKSISYMCELKPCIWVDTLCSDSISEPDSHLVLLLVSFVDLFSDVSKFPRIGPEICSVSKSKFKGGISIGLELLFVERTSSILALRSPWMDDSRHAPDAVFRAPSIHVTGLETHGGPGAIGPRIFQMAPRFLRSGARRAP